MLGIGLSVTTIDAERVGLAGCFKHGLGSSSSRSGPMSLQALSAIIPSKGTRHHTRSSGASHFGRKPVSR